MFYMFYKSKRTNSESNPSIIRVRSSIFASTSQNPGLDSLTPAIAPKYAILCAG